MALHPAAEALWGAVPAGARLEKLRGDASTRSYYRLHAPSYNMLDGPVVDSVREVAKMGHEVGLHYEPGFFLERDMDPVEGTRSDIRTFEEIVGFETHSIAQHQPATGPVLADISDKHP